MRIVITGGAGFIGSHLCEHFLTPDNEVICLDNLCTGNIANIQHLFSNRNFIFHAHDISEPITIMGKVDAVLHFASPASPVAYLKMPLETMKANSLGTLNLLNLNATFLLASTSEIYGEPQIHPQPESYWGNVNPNGPRSVYDESKRFSEALTMLYNREKGADTRIARLFNTYGPRMDRLDGRVVCNFITQAISNAPITLYGDGTQTRSLCYISDTVEGISRLLASRETSPVNIGNPHEITMLDLARQIIALTNSKSPITFHPLPQDDPTRRCPDISRATSLLRWAPEIPLRTGLLNTIEYFRNHR